MPRESWAAGGAGSAQPGSPSGCGLPRGAECAARGGFISASLASHYPAIPRLGQPGARPGLLGGAGRRGTLDAGFRLWDADPGPSWRGPRSPRTGLYAGACARKASPSRAGESVHLRGTYSESRLPALGGESSPAGQEVCRSWRVHRWRRKVYVVFTSLTRRSLAQAPHVGLELAAPLLCNKSAP